MEDSMVQNDLQKIPITLVTVLNPNSGNRIPLGVNKQRTELAYSINILPLGF